MRVNRSLNLRNQSFQKEINVSSDFNEADLLSVLYSKDLLAWSSTGLQLCDGKGIKPDSLEVLQSDQKRQSQRFSTFGFRYLVLFQGTF